MDVGLVKITVFQKIDETRSFSVEVYFCMDGETHYAKNLKNVSEKTYFFEIPRTFALPFRAEILAGEG